jgi:hypothetical protein
MSDTRRLINLATKLAAEPDRDAAVKQLAREAHGDRDLVRRAHHRLVRDYMPTTEAQSAAALLNALLDPTMGWETELDDLDQRLLEVVREAESRMRVLAGGDPAKLRAAGDRLPGETPERRAARSLMHLAAERAARARQVQWPVQPTAQHGDTMGGPTIESSTVVFDLTPVRPEDEPGAPGRPPGR